MDNELKKYKVVVNTAAGRRRYMQYLIPQILASEIVDRYDIWVNTTDARDIEFFREVAEKYPKINLVWQPDGIVNGISSINAFYRKCIEPETIYFKLDDDIIWLEDDAIEKMVDFRIKNPNYFLVSPIVINNSLSTYLLTRRNKLNLTSYFNSNAAHEILWKSGKFALELHEWFLNNFLVSRRWKELHMANQEMAMCRFSINAILWFGDEMAKFNGIVPGDDEEWLSCIYPTANGMSNCWNGNALMAHFAFFTQRALLDENGILDKYGRVLRSIWGTKVKQIDDNIQSILKKVENLDINELNAKVPYKKEVLKPKRPVVLRIKSNIDTFLLKHFPTFHDAIARIISKKKKYII